MLYKLGRMLLIVLMGLGCMSCGNSKAACDVPEADVIDRINESMRHHMPDASLENGHLLESTEYTNSSLIIGEISLLSSEATSPEFTYGIWVLSEDSQIIASLSGNAKTYSSLSKASVDQEVAYFQSGDITKARACMKN